LPLEEIMSFPLGPDVPFAGVAHVNPGPIPLVEWAVARGEAHFADNGSLVVDTRPHTGRSAKDKYVVRRPENQDRIDWGNVNHPLEPADFAHLRTRVLTYLGNREHLYIMDGWAGADPRHRLAVRFITDRAWHALFFFSLLRRVAPGESFTPEVTLLHAPGLPTIPEHDGIHGSVAIALDIVGREIVIAGTNYAGEVKKSVFSFLNGWLPERDVFPMHCSANIGDDGKSALLFGLSGTGKTTLSADPERKLIGDDEHGWSEDGVFNFEGGCYAKCIHLSPRGEPLIWAALRFGSIVENVVMDPITRRIDFDSDAITENTRVVYPLDFIPGAEPSGRGGHPNAILFLTCDAYGVLPPLARLTPEQALYHFLTGYTAKAAGTEVGVKTATATFSACFGAPFLTLPASRYVEQLRQRLERHKTPVWLVNTGWTGGPYGVGRRMPLEWTRTLVRAVLAGRLDDAPMSLDPLFNLNVPVACPGVPDEAFDVRASWADPAAYDAQAQRLAAMFKDNFKKLAGSALTHLTSAGPR
jgi:phosphoenolpyruvate carboxykinase (ATP)